MGRLTEARRRRAALASLGPFLERIFRDARRAGRREPYEAYGADALVAMARSANRPGPDGPGPRATVHVRVDHAALLRGHTEAAETCEVPGVGPVPVATVRALADDAVVYGSLTKGLDVIRLTHLGRRPTAAQRKALEARDPTCVVPGCDVRDHLEIDHVTGWTLTRRTKLDDLARLCAWHHHLKTHCGYRLEGPPGERRWVHPDRRRGPAPQADDEADPVLDLGGPVLRNAERPACAAARGP